MISVHQISAVVAGEYRDNGVFAEPGQIPCPHCVIVPSGLLSVAAHRSSTPLS
jgi:hypothetical protein